MALQKRAAAGNYDPPNIEDYAKTPVTLAAVKDLGFPQFADSKPVRRWQFEWDVDGTEDKVFSFHGISINEGPNGMAKFGKLVNAAFGRAKSEPIDGADDETLEVWLESVDNDPDGKIEPGLRLTVIGTTEPDKGGTPRYNISEYLPAQKRAASAPARAAKPVATVNDPSDY